MNHELTRTRFIQKKIKIDFFIHVSKSVSQETTIQYNGLDNVARMV
jgi:hypothetical protein